MYDSPMYYIAKQSLQSKKIPLSASSSHLRLSANRGIFLVCIYMYKLYERVIYMYVIYTLYTLYMFVYELVL